MVTGYLDGDTDIEEAEHASDRRADSAGLADLAQVHRLADEVLDRYPQLHALVNNAGVGFGSPGSGREVSADGIELRFAVNHLASYLLARRLAGLLVASAPARIVQVASDATKTAPPIPKPTTPPPAPGYASSPTRSSPANPPPARPR